MKKPANLFQKTLMTSIALSLWVIVLQNFHVFGLTRVEVENKVKIGGSVSIDEPVEITGSIDVGSIYNTVDINIKEITGRSAAAYHAYTIEGREYSALGVNDER